MQKAKYKYNPNTLSYEKIKLTYVDKLKKFSTYLITGLIFAAISVVIAYQFIDSPEELILKRENDQLRKQYNILSKDISKMESVLKDMQNRDDNIYRAIFEAEPIPENIRRAGVGGVNRYSYLEGYNSSDDIIETTYRLDKLAKQMYIQSKSFDEVIELARKKEEMLSSIPAIQPVANKVLDHVASGYGMRMHPIYKVMKMHTGLDFAAAIGTEIYAAGDGAVELVEDKFSGYGRSIVIKHGFGYQTLYAHMSVVKVRRGQKVKRGDVIGLVGSTGTSSGPHLHYEVIKDGQKIDPANFFFNDLTPEEYDLMLEKSSNATQSFD
jgi:murein DD-endopeptidase MepM/ murein hydrolase activator NlpD